jgi:hypothetical protein
MLCCVFRLSTGRFICTRRKRRERIRGAFLSILSNENERGGFVTGLYRDRQTVSVALCCALYGVKQYLLPMLFALCSDNCSVYRRPQSSSSNKNSSILGHLRSVRYSVDAKSRSWIWMFTWWRRASNKSPVCTVRSPVSCGCGAVSGKWLHIHTFVLMYVVVWLTLGVQQRLTQPAAADVVVDAVDDVACIQGKTGL